jgi:hypothetical protein
VVWEVDGGVAHAALRTLAQHRGMLRERVDVELDGQVRYVLDGVDMDRMVGE